MNHWCESCARKNMCYMVDNRPKCFVPITNTASGTSESYLAKSLRDSHEIAKDEPQTEEEILREQCRDFMGIVEQTERRRKNEQ